LSEAGACVDGRLADELAATLEPQLQDALNHPTRREILRILHASDQACAVTGILDQLSPLTRSEISYHLRVLRDAGSIFDDGTRPAPGGREVLYRSALRAEAGVIAALWVTEQLDCRRRKAGDEPRPSSALTMFRIPRPGRTIRLRNWRERKTDREG
jgi:DNA-binding transcriptional ArsR family regulator